MAGNEALELEFVTVIKADPELVYEFFTDAELIARWHGVAAAADPRPGGAYELNITGKDYKVGEFLELDPPNKLVFTWGHPKGVDDFPPGSSVVTVTFLRIPEGTRLNLHQTNFPNRRQRDAHEEGWTHYLSRLEKVATGSDPGRDPRKKCDPPVNVSERGVSGGL